MKKIAVNDAPPNSSTYELDDGRVVRVHLKLLTPEAELAQATFVEVETTAYEVNKAGDFIVGEDGQPIVMPKRKDRIPLDNLRAGAATMKSGWAKVDLSYNPEKPREDLKDVKKVAKVPKTGAPGDRVYAEDEQATYVYSEGLYEAAMQRRVGEFAALVTSDAPPSLSAAQLADLRL